MWWHKKEPEPDFIGLRELRFITKPLYTETIFELQVRVEDMIMAVTFENLIDRQYTFSAQDRVDRRLYDYFLKDDRVHPVEAPMLQLLALGEVLEEALDIGMSPDIDYYRRLSVPLIHDIQMLKEALRA